jgi:hypothetical protein
MKIRIAFFKGSEGPLHRFIRWWTKSKYSHAELVMPDGKTWISISPFLSSRVSARIKGNEVNPENWDYLDFYLNWREPVKDYQLNQLYKFIDKTQGCKYDWTGMIMSQLCPFLVKRRDKWYCSEWIAHAMVNARIVMWDDIHLYDTPDLSPGKLYELLEPHAQAKTGPIEFPNQSIIKDDVRKCN